MEPNSTYDQEIDLKDLMFAVLYKWRPVVIAAVVIGILLGGFKAFSTYKSQNDPTVIAEKEADYQKNLEIYEKNKSTGEREIDNLLNDITEQQTYLEKSVRMNMSPYDVWEAKIDLFVKTDYVIMPDMVYQNVDYTDTILQAVGIDQYGVFTEGSKKGWYRTALFEGTDRYSGKSEDSVC